jgi:hypothetical protein
MDTEAHAAKPRPTTHTLRHSERSERLNTEETEKRERGNKGINPLCSLSRPSPSSPPCSPLSLCPHFRPAAFGAVLLSAILLAGCARKAQAPESSAVAYPYSAEAPRLFYATASGLAESPGTGASGTGAEAEPRLASQSPNASVLSADSGAIAAAVNGWGLVRIEPSPASGEAYRIVGSPLPAGLAGLATAGAWPLDGGFLIQLYRDPFAEGADSGKAGPARLLFMGGSGTVGFDPLPGETGLGYELFALLPASGTWYSELRKDAQDRVDLKFFALDDPVKSYRARTAASPNPTVAAAAAIREIRRADFEAALKPRSLDALAPAEAKALRTALAALGKGPWLVRLRSCTGADAWYLSSGMAEEASPAYAWSREAASPSGGGSLAEVTILRSDGWIARADEKGGTEVFKLPKPSEDAIFVAMAAIDELVAAAWESGEFPTLSSAGLTIGRLHHGQGAIQ